MRCISMRARWNLEAIEVPIDEITPAGENQTAIGINQAAGAGGEEGVEVALWLYIMVASSLLTFILIINLSSHRFASEYSHSHVFASS